jgi:hypothetical protein
MLAMTLPTERNNNVINVARHGANQSLDGTSAAATSTVISATDYSVVHLSSADTIYYAIGTNPIATASDIILPGGWIDFVLAPGEKVSVLGGKASLTVWV